MGRIFGTDGVRGVANRDLTPEVALRLAEAGASVLAGLDSPSVGGRPTAVVGRDPRASGEFLEAAVVAGLASTGVDVRRLGVLPTPGVAYLTSALGADFGVMISASHNPMPDNGIKFFARGGAKLEDAIEDQIEALYVGEPRLRPTGADVGRVTDDLQAGDRYVAHLSSTMTASLVGLRIVLDCAEGAASIAAPQAFAAAGADVVAIHNQPDGLNINHNCGSTHLAGLQAAVVAAGADAGFAFDGDADRCLAIDAAGDVIDGDQLLAILAIAMRDSSTLKDNTLVATVMSNLGFLNAMDDAGIIVVRAQVGDRYVLEEMRAGSYSLGGEQSGHLIMSEHATTGDGILTALHVSGQLATTGRPLAELAGVVQRLPQVLVNVAGVDKSAAATDESIADAVSWAEAELGTTGRVLLRPSGTEALIRVMVEAETEQRAHEIADRLAAVVRAHATLATP